ncbi:hypothetical protein [Parasitella parasitica]|uniref:XPG N-terminal domain-containing protein n=1 Tax=Parasitella parasitica TaxID=35722 RepID=A0A0B7NPG4_9FUNG|nr:hypothetical protein [Parasitella parasitica]
MGVHGLTAILKRYAPNSVRTVSCKGFSQQTIAIDASCHLNKFIYGIEGHQHPHIYGFYQLAKFCSLNEITPLFVFDGPYRLDAKKLEHAKRARSRRKVKHSLRFEKEQSVRLDSWSQISDEYGRAYMSKELIRSNEDAIKTHDGALYPELRTKISTITQELQDAIIMAEDTEKYTRTVRGMVNKEKDLLLDAITSLFKDDKSALCELQKENEDIVSSLDFLIRITKEKRSFRITQELRDQCQEFLTAFGYVCLSCDHHEAEAMCASLAHSGRAVATVSEDLDTIAFGDVPILRHFFAHSRPILSIDPVIARRDLGISRPSFIDLCILCGTDFSGTIKGMGPHRALSAIQKYGSIEQVLANLNSSYAPQDTRTNSLKFLYPLPPPQQVFNDLPSIPSDDKSYEPPATNEQDMAHMLQLYEIDPVEADLRVNEIILQQSRADVQGWGPNPFSSSFAANITVDPKLLHLA